MSVPSMAGQPLPASGAAPSGQAAQPGAIRGCIGQWASTRGQQPALVDTGRSFTYAQLDAFVG